MSIESALLFLDEIARLRMRVALMQQVHNWDAERMQRELQVKAHTELYEHLKSNHDRPAI